MPKGKKYNLSLPLPLFLYFSVSGIFNLYCSKKYHLFHLYERTIRCFDSAIDLSYPFIFI